MISHAFTGTIREILKAQFGDVANEIFERNLLLQYVNIKTRSANRGAKARGSFANLYAIYVLTEDFIRMGFDASGDYSKYEGAVFTRLFKRQRELPFGSKLQNHALNHRMNEEFKKFFPTCPFVPILRNAETNRYWFNSNLLASNFARKEYNVARAVISIIDAYVAAKRQSFDTFIQACHDLKGVVKASPDKAEEFISSLLAPNVDARLFEIVSFSILKSFYHNETVFFGYSMKEIKEERLKLYKTGRTNANDGGIDFVMRPLGRFFQVTETLDTKKYFLDIDKLERFPISFVIKSEESVDVLRNHLQLGARQLYGVESLVVTYMKCIEELINVPRLRDCFKIAVSRGYLPAILDEIVIQSKVEFNYSEEIDPGDDEDDA